MATKKMVTKKADMKKTPPAKMKSMAYMKDSAKPATKQMKAPAAKMKKC
jgi:hypothetical protein